MRENLGWLKEIWLKNEVHLAQKNEIFEQDFALCVTPAHAMSALFNIPPPPPPIVDESFIRTCLELWNFESKIVQS